MKGDCPDGYKPSNIDVETTMHVSDVVISERVVIDHIAKKCTFKKCIFVVSPSYARVQVMSGFGVKFMWIFALCDLIVSFEYDCKF